MTERQIQDFRFRGLRIPEHMIGSVLRYFNDHLRPGDFLEALLANDFMEAWRSADDRNAAAFEVWGAFIYNLAPTDSYGSAEKVKAWLKHEATNAL